MTFTVTVAGDTLDDLKSAIAELAAEMADDSGATADKPKTPRKKAAATAPAKAEEPEEPQVSEKDVRESAERLIQLGMEGAKASVAILKQAGVVNDAGQPKLAAIKPEQHAEVKALFDAKFAEIEAESKSAGGIL